MQPARNEKVLMDIKHLTVIPSVDLNELFAF